MLTRPSDLESAFHHEVSGFTVPEHDFCLRYEFAAIDKLRSAGVVEAVVIFCSRILERLSAHSLKLLGKSPRDDLGFNLRNIRKFAKLSNEQWAWFNQLRDMGNNARHANREFREVEADLAFLIMIRWIQWFFCEFNRGPQLTGITENFHSLNTLLPAKWVELLDQLDRADLSSPDFVGFLRLNDKTSWVYFSPVVPNVLIERLIDRKRFDCAQQVLDAIQRHFHSVSTFRNDQRSRQLQALIWSNTGRHR